MIGKVILYSGVGLILAVVLKTVIISLMDLLKFQRFWLIISEPCIKIQGPSLGIYIDKMSAG